MLRALILIFARSQLSDTFSPLSVKPIGEHKEPIAAWTQHPFRGVSDRLT